MTQEELKQKFAQILSSLPNDKKMALFNKLQSLPNDEREKAIISIVQKYEATNNSVQHNNIVSNQEIRPIPERIQNTPVRKKKKLKKSAVKAIRLAVIIFVLCASALVLFLNRDNLFNKGTEREAVESLVESVQVEETVLPTATPTPSPTATPTPSPTPSPIPMAENSVDLTGLIVVLDPGHQSVTSDEMENCASWLGTEKPRCTSGAVGVTTGVTEYDLTLSYAEIIGTYLEQSGATVIYTRTESDVDISNQERAAVAISNNADVFIRLHTDAANDSYQSGVRVYVADSGDYSSSVVTWGQTLGELVAEQEGFEFESPMASHLYTGLNYANSVPSFQISLGFLSNSDDEYVLTQESNMVRVAYAIAEFCSEFVE